MIKEPEPHNLAILLARFEAAGERLNRAHTTEPRDENEIEAARNERDAAIEAINGAYARMYEGRSDGC